MRQPIPDPPNGVRFCRKCNCFLSLSDFPSGKRRHECKVRDAAAADPFLSPPPTQCLCQTMHNHHSAVTNTPVPMHTHISNRSMCGLGPARHAGRCSQTPRGGQCGTSGTMHGWTHNISWARETSASPRQRSEICFRKATWSQTPPSTESFPGTPARHSLQRMHPWSPWLPGRPSWPCGEVLSLQIVRLCASPRSGCCMQAHLSPPPVNEVEQCRGHSQRGNVLKYTEPE